jgi:dUTP pyrophosphatase
MSANEDNNNYRADYKTSDPNWWEGFNHRIKIGESERIVGIKQLHPEARTPAYKTAGAAGMDLCACETLKIEPGTHTMVRTGIALAIPSGLVGLVCPRSGLAAQYGITVLNAPGVIDSDYRGEIKVLLVNHGRETFSITVGDRVAQLLITPVIHAILQGGADLSETERGIGGFGSTGR